LSVSFWDLSSRCDVEVAGAGVNEMTRGVTLEARAGLGSLLRAGYIYFQAAVK
jgi:hypothetical protein